MVPSVILSVPVRVSVLVFRSKMLPVAIVRLVMVLSESRIGSNVTLFTITLSVVLGRKPRSQLVVTLQSVEVVPSQVKSEAVNVQLVLFRELCEVVAVMPLVAIESLTST